MGYYGVHIEERAESTSLRPLHTPETTRTSDLLLRRQSLYPPELPGHVFAPTPDAIRTHDLLLRRESLYPTELPGHSVYNSIHIEGIVSILQPGRYAGRYLHERHRDRVQIHPTGVLGISDALPVGQEVVGIGPCREGEDLPVEPGLHLFHGEEERVPVAELAHQEDPSARCVPEEECDLPFQRDRPCLLCRTGRQGYE